MARLRPIGPSLEDLHLKERNMQKGAPCRIGSEVAEEIELQAAAGAGILKAPSVGPAVAPVSGVSAAEHQAFSRGCISPSTASSSILCSSQKFSRPLT